MEASIGLAKTVISWFGAIMGSSLKWQNGQVHKITLKQFKIQIA